MLYLAKLGQGRSKVTSDAHECHGCMEQSCHSPAVLNDQNHRQLSSYALPADSEHSGKLWTLIEQWFVMFMEEIGLKVKIVDVAWRLSNACQNDHCTPIDLLMSRGSKWMVIFLCSYKIHNFVIIYHQVNSLTCKFVDRWSQTTLLALYKYVAGWLDIVIGHTFFDKLSMAFNKLVDM